MFSNPDESIRTLEEHDASKWDQFVLRHPLGSIYHTTAWMRVVQKTFKHEPLYIYLEENEKIRACLPLFRVSSWIAGEHLACLPATTVCDPLADEKDLVKLMVYAQGRPQQVDWTPWEIRTGVKFQASMPFPSVEVLDYVTHLLDLDRSLEAIWKSLHKGQVVRSIRKARRSGLVISDGCDKRDFSEFYKLYLGMRKRNGLLPQPLSFFLNLWEEFSPTGNIELKLAWLNSRLVSGVLLLKYRDVTNYEYGATDPAALKSRPSQLLLWRSIEKAHADGYRWFDFGRTRLDNIGLLNFKDLWGTSRIPLVYYQAPEGTKAHSMHKNRFLTRSMHILMQNSPNRVCQWLGGWLYRHTL